MSKAFHKQPRQARTSLSPRERVIVQHVARFPNDSKAQTAARAGVSVHTVESQLRTARLKAGVQTTLALVLKHFNFRVPALAALLLTFTGCVTTTPRQAVDLPPMPPNPPLRQLSAHYAATGDESMTVTVPEPPAVFRNEDFTVTALAGAVTFASNELWARSIQLSTNLVNWTTMNPDMRVYGTSVIADNFNAIFARIGLAE